MSTWEDSTPASYSGSRGVDHRLRGKLSLPEILHSPACCAVECIQQNTCGDTGRLLSHFTFQHRFKNRRSYKYFTWLDVVVTKLSETRCSNFEFTQKHRRFLGRSFPSKAYVYRPLIIGVAVSIPSEGMDVCLLCLLCVEYVAASWSLL